jgi:hypothetical protein
VSRARLTFEPGGLWDAFEKPLGAAGEVLAVADQFDLSFEGVDDETLTLVPLTRATASAPSARSSGRRTVVCLVMPS